MHPPWNLDIWGAVLDYLPPTDILKLRAISRNLRDIAGIGRRTLTLRLDSWNSKTKTMLKEIGGSGVRDLFREVIINPWPISSTRRSKDCRTLGLSRLQQSFHTWFDPTFPQRQAEALLEKRARKQARLIIIALNALSTIDRLTLDWEGGPRYQHVFVAELLTPILSHQPFAGNLRTLILKVPPDRLGSLYRVDLPQLEALECTFITGAMSSIEINQKLEGFVTFVNNLYLHRLSLSSDKSCLHLDLTSFFHRLGDFPRLHSFALSIPFDGTHLSDPHELRVFLQRHARHLKRVSLRAGRIDVRPNDSPSLNLDPNCKAWIQIAIDDLAPFATDLRKLELALRPLRADLTPLYRCLSQLTGQLETLILTDRRLTYEEIGELLNASYGGVIKRLGVRVQRLSPELLDLIADRLPKMLALELTFSSIVHSENSLDRGKEVELPLFLTTMLKRRTQPRYRSWMLQELAVPEAYEYGRRCSPFTWLRKLEVCLVELIPSVQIRQLPYAD
ncbi:hypothetical protein C8J56DRAFT_1061667 [Mycena floridula]|nr:hypothetical protein C8J56DRAFT_1061667 [Mycena floridula]